MIQTLLTVPPHLADYLRRETAAPTWRSRLESWSGRELFIHADPAGLKLGSGGGTVNVLHAAWRAAQTKASLEAWLETLPKKLILHSGGESRRLPAYASVGKAFMPLPAIGDRNTRCFDQILADRQLPGYTQTLIEAGSKAVAMVCSGDVWLDFNPLDLPVVQADIAGIGMRVAPEVAQHFGVYFVRKDLDARPNQERPIAFFLQKPKPSEIYRHLGRYDFFVDTGMWLLSAAAAAFLFRRCGWDARKQRFANKDNLPGYLDLYTEVGGNLGAETKPSAELSALGFGQLTSSVIPLETARFYHLGSNRQIFESLEQLQSGLHSPAKCHFIAAKPGDFVSPAKSVCWVEAATPDAPVTLGGANLVTGLPAGSRITRVPDEVCLEVLPVGPRKFAVRPYHIDDTLRGRPSQRARICGQDAAAWLAARGLPTADEDVFNLPLYPVVNATEIDQALLEWFFATQPDESVTRRWQAWQREAAAALPHHVDFARYFEQRKAGHAAALQAEFTTCMEEGDTRVFAQDFSAVAAFCRTTAPELAKWIAGKRQALLAATTLPELQSRLLLFLAEISEGKARERFEDEGYRRLRSGIVAADQLGKVSPRLALKEDQIVWSRSPVRLDLAGGWTDTPPYCLEYGGAVVNVAVLLNGQPPIQVFVRRLAEPEFRLRSIDLGSSDVVRTYAQLAGYQNPQSGFSLPKAALALAGFHPDFAAGKAQSTLKERLQAFGGGLEISLLSAVPKGSGLGTSSIIGATLLGALNRACALSWDEVALYNRVLGVEQLLTTGGGWQDQAGALFRSLKLIETQPGARQTPAVRYLPEHLLDSDYANRTYLLYYTGVTRLAKGILKEIVRDMFLGNSATLHSLGLIRRNAWELYHSLQQGNPTAVQRTIARSWMLNKRLDAGTSTPDIEAIIATCGDDLAACKLLGAGGGGYMLLCAADAAAGQRIRDKLEANPPNARARFIDFAVARTGLQVTVS